jgi:hypothetical protein
MTSRDVTPRDADSAATAQAMADALRRELAATQDTLAAERALADELRRELAARDAQLLQQIDRSASCRDAVVKVRAKYKRTKADLEATRVALDHVQQQRLDEARLAEARLDGFQQAVTFFLDRDDAWFEADVVPTLAQLRDRIDELESLLAQSPALQEKVSADPE